MGHQLKSTKKMDNIFISTACLKGDKNYDRVINEMNSLTSIPDLCKLVETICVKRSIIQPGIYNAINVAHPGQSTQ